MTYPRFSAKYVSQNESRSIMKVRVAIISGNFDCDFFSQELFDPLYLFKSIVELISCPPIIFCLILKTRTKILSFVLSRKSSAAEIFVLLKDVIKLWRHHGSSDATGYRDSYLLQITAYVTSTLYLSKYLTGAIITALLYHIRNQYKITLTDW